MSFLNIFYLAGIPLVVIPVLIHLFRKKSLIVVNLPTLRYLIKAQQRYRRSFVLSDIFLMLVRCLIILLLTIAMSQPYTGTLAGVGKNGTGRAIMMDVSMSMCAEGFMEKGKIMAKRIADNTPVSFLFTFSDAVEQIVRIPKEAIDDIIKNLQCTFKTTDIYKSLKDADAIMGDGGKEIYLITDLTANGWDLDKIASLLEEKQIELYVVDVSEGRRIKNYYVKGVSQQKNVAGTTLSVTVGSSTNNREEIPVVLRMNGSGGIKSKAVPGEAIEFSISHDSPTDGFVELTGDELSEDNRYYFSVEMEKKPDILVVDGAPDPRPFRSGSYFFVKAINSLQDSLETEYYVIPPSGLPEQKTLDFDIFCFLNVPPIQGDVMDRIFERISNGAGLFFTSGNNTDTAWFRNVFLKKIGITMNVIQEGGFRFSSISEGGGYVTLSKKDERFFKDIEIKKKILLLPVDSDRVSTLISFNDNTPAVLESRLGEGRVVVLATSIDAEWTNFPVSGIFLPFIHEVLLRLAGGYGLKSTQHYVVGRYNMPEEMQQNNNLLIAPDGKSMIIPLTDTTIELNKPGIWKLNNNKLIVNTNQEESAMMPLSKEEVEKATGNRVRFYHDNAISVSRKPFKPLWKHFIFLLLSAFTIEAIISGKGK